MHRPHLFVGSVRLLSISCLLALLLAADGAFAQVSCGDTIGPNQVRVMTGNLFCTVANTDGECALTVRGPNAFLRGNGHRLRCDGGPSGVCLVGTGASVVDLKIRNCEEGVEVSGGGGHSVENVRVRGSDQDGIGIDSSDNTLRDTSSKNNGENGVGISGNRNWLYRVVANGNADDGFVLEDDSDGEARENDLQDIVARRNSRNGLQIESGATNNDIRNAVLQDNDLSGADVAGDRNEFTKVDFVGNADHGLNITSQGEENHVSESDLSENTNDGLRIAGDRNQAHENDILDNDRDGVRLTGASNDNVVTGNTIAGNANMQIRDNGTGNITAPNP